MEHVAVELEVHHGDVAMYGRTGPTASLKLDVPTLMELICPNESLNDGRMCLTLQTDRLLRCRTRRFDQVFRRLQTNGCVSSFSVALARFAPPLVGG